MQEKQTQQFYYPYEVPIPKRGYVNIFRNKKDGLRYIRKSDGSDQQITSVNGEFYNLGKISGATNYTSDNIDVFNSDDGLIVRFVQAPQQIIISSGGGNAPAKSVTAGSTIDMFQVDAVGDFQISNSETDLNIPFVAPYAGTAYVHFNSYASFGDMTKYCVLEYYFKLNGVIRSQSTRFISNQTSASVNPDYKIASTFDIISVGAGDTIDVFGINISSDGFIDMPQRHVSIILKKA